MAEDYERLVDLTTEVATVRSELMEARAAYFDLRQEHFSQSRWWTRAGAGTPHELALQMHADLAEDRSALADYWYFPSGKHNPYLDLLYSAMPSHGFRVRELATLDDLAALPPSSVLHMHWIESLRPNGDDESASREALDRARAAIDSFLADSSNRLIWSVHEPLPHGTRWPELDAAFHQFLSDRAHVVHVLHDSTKAACEQHFDLDAAKSTVVELPLYDGVYSNYRARPDARALLGVADDELCVVFFGAIRAYKGLDELVEAAEAVAGERSIRLMVAGMPVGPVDDLVERVAGSEHGSIAASLVPDSEIQTLLGAADVVVVPYKTFLNSAVLMLSLSFGVPVIATRNPVTADAERSGLVSTYTTAEELRGHLVATPIGAGGIVGADYAAAHAPSAIADRFGSLVADSMR